MTIVWDTTGIAHKTDLCHKYDVTMTDFAAQVFLKDKSKMTGDCCVFKFLQRSAGGKHLSRIQSENADFKFLRRSVVRALDRASLLAVYFAAVIREVTQRFSMGKKRCVTTQIAVALEATVLAMLQYILTEIFPVLG